MSSHWIYCQALNPPKAQAVKRDEVKGLLIIPELNIQGERTTIVYRSWDLFIVFSEYGEQRAVMDRVTSGLGSDQAVLTIDSI